MPELPLRRHAPHFALLALLTLPLAAQNHQEFRFAREGVLGTSSNLVVLAPDETTAQRAEAAVYAEVARLEAIFSTWRDDSELSQLLRSGGGPASAELREALRVADLWRTKSHGAFEPGAAALTKVWRAAESTGQPPAAAALTAAAATLREPVFRLVQDRVAVRAPFDLDGIAKGYIVDRAAAKVAAVQGAQLHSFQIGGETRIGGKDVTIALVDPRQPAANGTPLATVTQHDCAVASSGGYARGFDIGGTHHSHVLDPRTGKPCDHVLGASVLAKDTATADALATTLCVLGADGLALVRSTPGAEAFVVTADGVVHATDGLREALQAAHGPTTAWPKGFGLKIEFAIQGPAPAASGNRRGGWKRPYVAVWIEDLTGSPARTLCLWIEDRRWLRDLRRWSRLYADQPRFADQVSQATRKAGAYTLQWDGLDDDGRPLAPGKYTVLIEVCREHGTYQLMKQELDLRTAPVQATLADNEEVHDAKLTFGPQGKGR